MKVASTSFPAPDSPSISMFASLAAALSAIISICLYWGFRLSSMYPPLTCSSSTRFFIAAALISLIFRTSIRSSSGSFPFVTYEYAPFFIVSTAFSIVPNAVSISTSVSYSRSLIFFRSSNPSITGMFRSDITTSKLRSSSISSASFPFKHVSTAYPLLSRIIFRTSQ